MKKFLLKIFFAVGALVLLFGIALVFLSSKIKDIKEPLLNVLKSQIDGELQIAEAKVVTFPLGIDLQDVKLFAPGENSPSAEIEKAQLRFSLFPLVQKKIEASLKIQNPQIKLYRGKDGKSNMEKIFAPLLLGNTKESTSLDELWWKQLAINKLKIEDAHFSSIQEKEKKALNIKNININADNIRFEPGQEPAHIQVEFSLPEISPKPMLVDTRMSIDAAKEILSLSEGKFSWGDVNIAMEGEAKLPGEKQKDVLLNFNFGSDKIDLQKLASALHRPIPASGIVKLDGKVSKTAFQPAIDLKLSSAALTVSDKKLSNFQAELHREGEPIEIKTATLEIYGGTIKARGKIIPANLTSAQLNTDIQGLSLAEISGKKDNPARLNAKLQLQSKNISNMNALTGGGDVSVGPILIPPVDLKNKVKLTEILTAGTAVSKMININMLSSSQNVIGSRIEQVNAKIKINGGNVTLAPLSMANDHFNALANGTVVQQKSINASGRFNLNSATTTQLLPDPKFRAYMTQNKGFVSVPFTVSGPLEDPNVTIDNSYLKSMVAKATAMGITNILAEGVKPQEMLNSALKNTPLSDPKNPLGQILGTSPKQSSPDAGTTKTNTTTRPQQKPSTTTQQRPSSGNKTLDQFLFGK